MTNNKIPEESHARFRIGVDVGGTFIDSFFASGKVSDIRARVGRIRVAAPAPEQRSGDAHRDRHPLGERLGDGGLDVVDEALGIIAGLRDHGEALAERHRTRSEAVP